MHFCTRPACFVFYFLHWREKKIGCFGFTTFWFLRLILWIFFCGFRCNLLLSLYVVHLCLLIWSNFIELGWNTNNDGNIRYHVSRAPCQCQLEIDVNASPFELWPFLVNAFAEGAFKIVACLFANGYIFNLKHAIQCGNSMFH